MREQSSSHGDATELVTGLLAIARRDLPADATDITDRADPLLEQAEARLAVDRDFRWALVEQLRATAQPVVREWLRSILVPSVHLGATEPERVLAQPGVPDAVSVVGLAPAVALGTMPDPAGSVLERRRLRRAPWDAAAGWLLGPAQRCRELTEWPRGSRRPLDLVCRLDLDAVSGQVHERNFSRIGVPAEGVLQVFADLGAASDETGRVDHTVVFSDPDSVRERLLSAPSGSAGPMRFTAPDSMITVPPGADLGSYGTALEGPLRHDYDVFAAVCAEDPYARNLLAAPPLPEGSPFEDGYAPVSPIARMVGHPVAPHPVWSRAVDEIGCDVGSGFVLFDGPCETDRSPVASPRRHPRLLVVADAELVRVGDLSRTAAVSYSWEPTDTLADLA